MTLQLIQSLERIKVIKRSITMKRLLILTALTITVIYLAQVKGYLDPSELPSFLQVREGTKTESPAEFTEIDNIRVLNEESAIISAIERALPSVVTVTIEKTTRTPDRIQINPFDPFSPFRQQPGQEQRLERNIGSGFAVGKDLIVTNKHVVSDTEAEFTVLDSEGNTYTVTDISRDPLNDLAILRLEGADLKVVEFGDSENLKLGQTVIAIGTPLGEFTNTVTTGIISGLGRGITAGSAYEGFVERLDNVIQTDAAINPGNSGGPLLNSQGQVIGVNTAVSAESENIGFAIPVNVITELISNFKEAGGVIARPYLGVRYKMITEESAILNEVPQGAYIVEVVEGSPAAEAGIEPGDIIVEFDGKKVEGEDDTTLQKIIADRKVGDNISVRIWRDSEFRNLEFTLGLFE